MSQEHIKNVYIKECINAYINGKSSKIKIMAFIKMLLNYIGEQRANDYIKKKLGVKTIQSMILKQKTILKKHIYYLKNYGMTNK